MKNGYASSRLREKTERNWSIYWAVCGGETQSAVARRVGISRERVQQIYTHCQAQRARDRIGRERTWMRGVGLLNEYNTERLWENAAP